jgi:hypothetical protein
MIEDENDRSQVVISNVGKDKNGGKQKTNAM